MSYRKNNFNWNRKGVANNDGVGNNKNDQQQNTTNNQRHRQNNKNTLWSNHQQTSNNNKNNINGRNFGQMQPHRDNNNSFSTNWTHSFDELRRNDGSLQQNSNNNRIPPLIPSLTGPQNNINAWDSSNRLFPNKWNNNEWNRGNTTNRSQNDRQFQDNLNNFEGFSSSNNQPQIENYIMNYGMNEDRLSFNETSTVEIANFNNSPSEQIINVPCKNDVTPIIKKAYDLPFSVTNDNSKEIQLHSISSLNPSGSQIRKDLLLPKKQEIEHNAEEVTRKLINQLTSMDKHNLKQMINNPNAKYDTAMQAHARKKIREEMRKQLRTMSLDQSYNHQLEPDECIDSDKIPDAVFEEIGRVLDLNLLGDQNDVDQDDVNSSEMLDQNLGVDETKSNVKLLCPDDIFLRAERLLMENSTFLLEERLNDTSISNSRAASPSTQPLENPNNDKTIDEIIKNQPIKSSGIVNQRNLFEEIDSNRSLPHLSNLSYMSTDFQLSTPVKSNIGTPVTSTPQCLTDNYILDGSKILPAESTSSNDQNIKSKSFVKKSLTELPVNISIKQEHDAVQNQNNNDQHHLSSLYNVQPNSRPLNVPDYEKSNNRSDGTKQVIVQPSHTDSQNKNLNKQTTNSSIIECDKNSKSSDTNGKSHATANIISVSKIDLKTKLQNLNEIKLAANRLKSTTSKTTNSSNAHKNSKEDSYTDKHDYRDTKGKRKDYRDRHDSRREYHSRSKQSSRSRSRHKSDTRNRSSLSRNSRSRTDYNYRRSMSASPPPLTSNVRTKHSNARDTKHQHKRASSKSPIFKSNEYYINETKSWSGSKSRNHTNHPNENYSITSTLKKCNEPNLISNHENVEMNTKKSTEKLQSLNDNEDTSVNKELPQKNSGQQKDKENEMKLRETLAVLVKTEADDEECQKIIENIEMLIDKQCPVKEESIHLEYTSGDAEIVSLSDSLQSFVQENVDSVLEKNDASSLDAIPTSNIIDETEPVVENAIICNLENPEKDITTIAEVHTVVLSNELVNLEQETNVDNTVSSTASCISNKNDQNCKDVVTDSLDQQYINNVPEQEDFINEIEIDSSKEYKADPQIISNINAETLEDVNVSGKSIHVVIEADNTTVSTLNRNENSFITEDNIISPSTNPIVVIDIEQKLDSAIDANQIIVKNVLESQSIVKLDMPNELDNLKMTKPNCDQPQVKSKTTLPPQNEKNRTKEVDKRKESISSDFKQNPKHKTKSKKDEQKLAESKAKQPESSKTDHNISHSSQSHYSQSKKTDDKKDAKQSSSTSNSEKQSTEGKKAPQPISISPRLWISPGEKKFMGPKALVTNVNSVSRSGEVATTSSTTHDKEKKTSKAKHKEKQSESPQKVQTNKKKSSSIVVQKMVTGLKVDCTESSTVIPDRILYHMKEIDLKLMDLQQQKMTIDEKMLRLQNEKMGIDQLTMQYQNERFLLLGSLLAKTSPVNNYHQSIVSNEIITKNSCQQLENKSTASIGIFKDIDNEQQKLTNINFDKNILKDVKTRKRYGTDAPYNEIHAKQKKSNVTPSTNNHQPNKAKSKQNVLSVPTVVTIQPEAKSKIVSTISEIVVQKIENKQTKKQTAPINRIKHKVPSSPNEIKKKKIKISSENNVKINKSNTALASMIHEIDSESSSSEESGDNNKIINLNETNKMQKTIRLVDINKLTKNMEQPSVTVSKYDDIINLHQFSHILKKQCKIVLQRIDLTESATKIAVNNSRATSILSIKSETDPTIMTINTVDMHDIVLSSDEDGFSGFNSINESIVFDGHFLGHRMPIVFLKVISSCLIAASEDGNIYKYDILTGKLLSTFTNHSKTVTWFVLIDEQCILSVSLDGTMRKFQFEDFETELLMIDVGEPLQVIEYCWNKVFIGSRSGKIYIFDTMLNKLNPDYLCSVGKSIMAIKATKEGPRNILIVSSRTNNINIRDATSGLLLRTIDVPYKITIYSILLDGGVIHCGTNQNTVLSYEFTNGKEINRRKVGIGTICMGLYSNSVILYGCYDGYIYAYDKTTGQSLERIQGPGKMLLHFDIVDDKIIMAVKDNKTLQVINIPSEITAFSTSSTVN